MEEIMGEDTLKRVLTHLMMHLKNDTKKKTYKNLNIESAVNSILELNGLLVSDRTETDNWVKTLYPANKSTIRQQGLIVVKKGSEYIIVMSGGYKKRRLCEKIKQEYNDRDGDTGKTLRERIFSDPDYKDKDCQKILENFDWIILSTDDRIFKAMLDALDYGLAFILNPKYKKYINYPEILEQYGKK